MSKKKFERSKRVGITIKKTLSDIIHKNINDPRLKKVTITKVNMSKDLKIAEIFFTMYSKNKEEIKSIEGFNSAKGYVKRKLAKQLKLKYIPDLKFSYDKSFDYGAHMNKVLKEVTELYT